MKHPARYVPWLAPPSEGKGHTFESCRCAIISITYPKRFEVSESKTHHKLTKNNRAPAQNLRGCGSFSYEQSADFLWSFDPESCRENTFAVAGR
jgi:hypothetical protein